MEYNPHVLTSVFKRTRPLISLALALILVVQALGPGIFAVQDVFAAPPSSLSSEDDSVFSLASIPPPASTSPSVDIVATKIVCTDEALLPDWANGGPDITATTAAEFLLSTTDRTAGCHLESGWDFQWGPESATDAGGLFVGPAGSPWSTFGPTNAQGFATTNVEISNVGSGIWVREELKNGFLGFSFNGNNDNQTSAEIYCGSDVINYDNYDFISPLVDGNTYHCIAFNVAEDQTPTTDNTCLLPIAPLLGDKISAFGLSHGGEISLQTVLDTEYGTGTIDTVNDETGYQSWSLPIGTQSVTIEGKYIRSISGNVEALGYYFDGNLSTFTPIFKNSALHSEVTQILSEGQIIPSVTISTVGHTSIGFAVDTEVQDSARYATQKLLNPANEDHAVVYNTAANTYVLGFEDLTFTPGDEDYQDLIVQIKVVGCENTAPCVPDTGMISSDSGTVITKVETDGVVTSTATTSVVVIDPVTQMQALYAGAWTATTTDSNAKWIWLESPVTDNEVDKHVTLSRTFTITGNPSEGLLQIATDNSYEVWINGNLSDPAHISDSLENNHSTNDVHTITPYLVSGSNTIAFRVKNWALPGQPATDNPAGLLYTLTWTSLCDGTPPPEATDLQVKIYKFLDGVQATASSSLNYNFPMRSMWNWPGNGGTGTYTLGTTGHGGSSAYQAFTSVMTAPADYQTLEITSDIDPASNVLPIGEACIPGKFRLVGYKSGATLSAAQSATLQLTHPIFTNLSSDQHVIVENETCPPENPIVTTIDVTMCKVDQNGAPLPGWTLALLGTKVDTVSVSGTGGVATSTSLPAASYALIANGTYVYRSSEATASTSDAAFSLRLPTDAVPFGAYAPWARVNDFPTPNTGWLGVMVNGTTTEWGTVFNSNHRYAFGTTTATTGPFTFSILDDNYTDNSGSIAVDIYLGHVGVTGSNGCVILEDVPVGDYSTDEIQQDGWMHVNGIGAVAITASTTDQIVIKNDNGDTTPDNLPCTVDCGGSNGPTITTTSNTSSRSSARGGGGSPTIAGITSSIGDNLGEILGATDEFPGLPNTGNGPLKGNAASTETFSILLVLMTAIMFNNLVAYRNKAK